MALKYEDIKEPFLAALMADKKATALYQIIEAGQGTYSVANEYAARVGEALASVLRANAPLENISEWDIEDLIPKSLGLDHSMVVHACQLVQDEINSDAGIGIRFIQPEFDGNRAYGIVNELRDHNFPDIQASFYEQLVNFSQNVVDESIRTNARVASNAGIEARIIRTADFKACSWCRAQAGSYNYQDVKRTGDDVWRRHENCRCTIDYVTNENGSEYRERVNNYRRTVAEGEIPREVVPRVSPEDTARFDENLQTILQRYNIPTNATSARVRAVINSLPLVSADRNGLLAAADRRARNMANTKKG